MNISPKLIKDCRKGRSEGAVPALQKLFSGIDGRLYPLPERTNQKQRQFLNAGFLKILNNLDRYQDNVPFEAWIRRIMINTLIDDFRKNRKVKELIEYTDFPELAYSDRCELILMKRISNLMQSNCRVFNRNVTTDESKGF